MGSRAHTAPRIGARTGQIHHGYGVFSSWIMPQSITDERGEERAFDLRFAQAL